MPLLTSSLPLHSEYRVSILMWKNVELLMKLYRNLRKTTFIKQNIYDEKPQELHVTKDRRNIKENTIVQEQVHLFLRKDKNTASFSTSFSSSSCSPSFSSRTQWRATIYLRESMRILGESTRISEEIQVFMCKRKYCHTSWNQSLHRVIALVTSLSESEAAERTTQYTDTFITKGGGMRVNPAVGVT